DFFAAVDVDGGVRRVNGAHESVIQIKGLAGGEAEDFEVGRALGLVIAVTEMHTAATIKGGRGVGLEPEFLAIDLAGYINKGDAAGSHKNVAPDVAVADVVIGSGSAIVSAYVGLVRRLGGVVEAVGAFGRITGIIAVDADAIAVEIEPPLCVNREVVGGYLQG